MTTTLEKILKAVFFAALFVPILVMPQSFVFPFIVPKIVAFRIAVTIMAACYALLLTSNFQKYRPPVTFFTLAIGLFFLSFGLSTFIGVDPYHSFWDNHERMLGLFTLIHYGLFFLIASSIFKTWSEWRTALTVFLCAGTIVMVVGLYQVVDPFFLLNQGDSRIISTLGNSIYVGGYGLFLFFVALLLAVKEKNPIWRFAQLAAGLLAFLNIFFSGSRGSFLGFSFGVFLVLLMYSLLLKEKEHRKARLAIWIVSGTLVVLVGFAYAFRTSPIVRALPTVARVLNTDWEGTRNSPRIYAWIIAVESWKDRPVFGWGPNNFFYAFNAHYNPKSLEHGYGETWFDNAHNILLNTLSVQGIFGLITYLSMFAAGAAILLKRFRAGELNREIFIIGLAFLLSHLVQNITVFENPTSYLYFMFWLAMLASLTRPKSEEMLPASKPVGAGALAGVSLVAFLFVFVFNVQVAKANMKTIEALTLISTDPVNSVEKIRQTLAQSTPHIDDIRSDLSVRMLTIVSSYSQQLGKAKSDELLAIVDDSLRKNMALHPLDIRVYLLSHQLKSTQASMKMDVSYIVSAEEIMTEAVRHSPRRQQLLYNLATIKLQLGKNDEAQKILEGTIQDNPLIGESYWRLAIVYRVKENPIKVREILDLGVKNNAHFTAEDKGVITELENYLATLPKTATKK